MNRPPFWFLVLTGVLVVMVLLLVFAAGGSLLLYGSPF